MWKYLFLANYEGRLDRSYADNGFEGARRANRAREDDERRAHAFRSNGGGRAAHPRALHLVRGPDELR
ncbi:hypothetical protein [Acuticoccus sp. I52.16.1]|uniref:hypothetical protein n=1 Tax=Acuticoccus sp. I52.16.1 TaxID=2928472 RepID=UPI001FD14F30|nr:hypothetical protein [Acuticoccus sp. I52.16.1]UOM34207.1 hypothetical protein MRB58_20650 [Acuticoccus sp. I52.16.1]